ncbi:Swt1 family HEPN domain-containing protein [Confluentibacter citreus]|uniref:Swt1 family HEPN domain-containing protein n=1 Tax=Confluentibacter citreus TaxID=2007307 RepID=UPI000C2814F3|nr:Swt1 family HEPN domain-containing protein [Confluentibacter citreus]
MKIGELVKAYIPKIFQYCENTDQTEIERLKDKDYSNKTFEINYPFCSINEKAALNTKRYWKDLYQINGELLRISSQWTIKHKEKFLIYLLDHNIITEIEFKNLDIKVQAQPNTASTSTIRKPLTALAKAQNLIINSEKYFDISLIEEANFMSIQYQKFYCLERSIRDLIRVNLESAYGNNWWDTLDDVVKRNVEMNLKYELDTTHTKRSEHKIDYTTFGDLRKIINSNWIIFEPMFNRNLTSVNEVMIDLNRLRVPIAHCTPLAEKEIKRLEIRMDDWHDLLVDF